MNILFHENFETWDNRSRAIDMFRMVAILCVLLAHLPYSFTHTDKFFEIQNIYSNFFSIGFSDSVYLFLKYGLGHVASPALSLVSAWFLLKGFEKNSASNVIINKFRTLIIPYFFWNFFHIFFFLILFYVTGRDEYHFKTDFLKAIFDGVLNPYKWPNNGPLHYLLDLFEIIFFTTILYKYFSKNIYIYALLALTSPFLLLKYGVSESWLGDNVASLLPRADLAFYFFIGVVTYKSHEYLFSKKIVDIISTKIFLFFSALFVFVASIYLYYYSNIVTHEPTLTNISLFYINLICRGCASVYILGLCLYLCRNFHFKLSRKLVFRIFCSHAIVIWVVNGVLNNYFTYEYRLVLYLLSFTVTVIIIYIINKVLNYFSKFSKLNWLKLV